MRTNKRILTTWWGQGGLREAELSDWKDNRMFRVMAVDHGLLSYVDVDHRQGWPVVLVTWPPRYKLIINNNS